VPSAYFRSFDTDGSHGDVVEDSVLFCSVLRKTIKDLVWGHEASVWKASQLMYPELQICGKSINGIKLHPWWLVAHAHPGLTSKVSGIMALLCGGQPTSVQRNIGSPRCRICSSGDSDNVIHVLFQCLNQVLAVLRQRLLNTVTKNMPPAMRRFLGSV
jgi:hypothetical protein